MLDCGSFCNFISSNLVSKLNLKTQTLKKKVLIKGISGDIDSILKFVPLKFQHKICINNKFYLIQRKLNFLVTDNIPVDLLFGIHYMKSYKIHYNYDKNYLYSTLNLKDFKSKIIKTFSEKKSSFNNYYGEFFDYHLLIYSFLSQKDNTNSEEPNIEDIPEQYRDLATVFSKKEADKLPPHRPTDCEIILKEGATLHYGPIYPLTLDESEVLQEYIKENREKGFIRESCSPAGYPVLFQKKKDGSLRLCVDYKKLNEVTVRNSYPLPLINDIIDRVKGAKYFTKLDLRSAYNLIRIKEGDEYKTAFRTKYGHYEYLVMPFGLKNAPAVFQSFINSVLRPFLEKSVILYLDDILIYSSSLEEHHKTVRSVLKTLLDNNLFAKLSKCEFDKDKVEFLGHIITGSGISTDPKKIKSIEEWPVPNCVKDVQRFMGLCNYYRRFVKNFAAIAKPLHALTKKGKKFVWSAECDYAFSILKKRLTSSPILLHPDTTKPFIVECDASSFAIGAVLSQYDNENRLHPVAYFSRSLNNAELNYSITDKELLAIKDAFSTWRHLLLGAKFKIKVFTDHKNLLYTLGGKIGNKDNIVGIYSSRSTTLNSAIAKDAKMVSLTHYHEDPIMKEKILKIPLNLS